MNSDQGRRELTPRQREVLGGVRRGLANKEIAYELGVGTDDVKRIVSRLLALFDAPNRTALAQAALPGSPDSCGFDLDFLSLFDEAPLAILATLGPDHVPCFANRAALATIPARPELPLVGTALRAALSGIECPEFLQLVEESFRTGDVSIAKQVRLRHRRGDHTQVVYLDVRVEPVQREADVCGLLVFAKNAVTIEASVRN
ncbi:MAG: helix-turn-helix transcriptional regulator [Chloroflexota bacterium]|nr:helix-turn-helix transcriptional regulator [Chloroflexota bacterium]